MFTLQLLLPNVSPHALLLLKSSSCTSRSGSPHNEESEQGVVLYLEGYFSPSLSRECRTNSEYHMTARSFISCISEPIRFSSLDQIFRVRPVDSSKNRVWTLSLRKLEHVYIWWSVNCIIVLITLSTTGSVCFATKIFASWLFVMTHNTIYFT